MNLPGLFITGTDTGVGKTAVTAAIASALTGQGRRVAVMKPVATGAERGPDGLAGDDTRQLLAAIGGHAPASRVTPLNYELPLAPPVAARQAGSPLRWEEFWTLTSTAIAWWQLQGSDLMLVEGVGGVLCPLTEEATVADLAVALDYPALLVARRGLGTLNHALMSAEALSRRGVRLAGIVLNQAEPPGPDEALAMATNPEELARWLPHVPILACLDYQSEPADRSSRLRSVDWYSRASLPRHSPPAGRPGAAPQ